MVAVDIMENDEMFVKKSTYDLLAADLAAMGLGHDQWAKWYEQERQRRESQTATIGKLEAKVPKLYHKTYSVSTGADSGMFIPAGRYPMHLIMNTTTGDVQEIYYGTEPEEHCRGLVRRDPALKLTLLSQVKTFHADVPVVETVVNEGSDDE